MNPNQYILTNRLTFVINLFCSNSPIPAKLKFLKFTEVPLAEVYHDHITYLYN